MWSMRPVSYTHLGIGNVEELVANLAAMHDTVGASQDGVVTQLQTEAGGILAVSYTHLVWLQVWHATS